MQVMNDRVYGKIHCSEPVLEAILTAPSFLRLQGVDQAGYSRPYYPTSTPGNRYNHSVGVWWLLAHYQAPLLEQIAGLLHDISHTAFSHSIDYALPAGSPTEQDYQDSIHQRYLAQSEIPALLAAYGFSLTDLADEDRFPLKEQPLPDLCADRLDYTLRDAIDTHIIKPTQARQVLAHLQVVGTTWVFDTKESASAFAHLFQVMNRERWSSIHAARMFASGGAYLKHAFHQRYITEADCFSTDEAVLLMINRHLETDPELARLWHRLNTGDYLVSDPEHYTEVVQVKSRAVDPLVQQGTKLRRLSELEPGWKAKIAADRQPRTYYFRPKQTEKSAAL